MYKYIFHLKNSSRGIVISEDSSLSLNDMIIKMSNAILSTELVEFSTKTDTLLVRPSDILAIQIAGGVNGSTTTLDVKEIKESNTPTDNTLQEEILQLEIDDPVNQIETNNVPVTTAPVPKTVNGKTLPPPLIPPDRYSKIKDIDLDSYNPEKKKKVSPWMTPIETKIPDDILETAKKGDGFIPYE